MKRGYGGRGKTENRVQYMKIYSMTSFIKIQRSDRLGHVPRMEDNRTIRNLFFPGGVGPLARDRYRWTAVVGRTGQGQLPTPVHRNQEKYMELTGGSVGSVVPETFLRSIIHINVK